jgi:small subunit ribosomal protein S7
MYDGKRGLAQTIVYDAFKIIENKLNIAGNEVAIKAIENASPSTEVKARRVGASNVQVPTPIRVERRQTLAIRWITLAARKRNEKNMDERLAQELIEAYNNTNTSGAIKKKEELQRMADANKAFAHFRW